MISNWAFLFEQEDYRRQSRIKYDRGMDLTAPDPQRPFYSSEPQGKSITKGGLTRLNIDEDLLPRAIYRLLVLSGFAQPIPV